jgi:hypothetical protein
VLQLVQVLVIAMEPLLGSEGPKDSAVISVIKRLFSELQLFAMSVNVISAVYSISATISLVTIPSGSVSVNNCAHGEPLFEQAQCAYANRPTFVGFITVWIIYFIVLLLFRFMHTSKFSTTDLRFYLACSMVNDEPLNKLLVLLGMGLTVACGAVGLTYALEDSFVTSVGGVGQILVFVGVNMLALFQIRRGSFASLCDPLVAAAALRQEIPIRLPMAPTGSLKEAVVAHSDIFNYIICAALADTGARDDATTDSVDAAVGGDCLAAMGDPRQLRSVARLMHSLLLTQAADKGDMIVSDKTTTAAPATSGSPLPP